MDKLRVADALTDIFNLYKRCNKYIDETEPWKLAKDEAAKARLATVLYNLLDGITFDDVILALHTERVIDTASAERVLKETLEIRLQDMKHLFLNNIDLIIAKAKEGRAEYEDQGGV